MEFNRKDVDPGESYFNTVVKFQTLKESTFNTYFFNKLYLRVRYLFCDQRAHLYHGVAKEISLPW